MISTFVLAALSATFAALPLRAAPGATPPATAAVSLPLPSGTRYLALGDSITRAGQYHGALALFQLTRFPDRDFTNFNAGISGDTAAGAIRRADWDVYPKKPDIVTVMFGMNDVDGSLYTPGKTGPENDAARLRAIDAYEKNLRKLVGGLLAHDMRVILLTPSPYDDTVKAPGFAANQPGRNHGLAECAERVRRVAADHGLTVVDFHGPMTALNHRLQQADPAFTLTGKDRVHPGSPGHFVMAYLLLKALGAPADVARVALDASGGGTVREAANCKITGLRATSGAVEFNYAARSLPFPVDAGSRPALAWVPFTEELNRETLSVANLASGRWRLEIDGETIRAFTAEELAAGVNLADEPATPQYRQALAVRDLFQKRQDAIGRQRDIAFVEHGAARDLPHPLTLDQVRPKLDAWLATAKGRPYEGFFKKCAAAYLADKPKEADFAAEIDRLMPEIRAAAQPRPHAVRLVRE